MGIKNSSENNPLSSKWHPSDNINDHSGRAISDDEEVVFFCSPPSSIGPLISASSTLKKGDSPHSSLIKLVAMLSAGFALALLTKLLLPVPFKHISSNLLHVLTIVISLMGVFWVNNLMKFSKKCSYVGSKGFFDGLIEEPLSKPPLESIVLFEDVSALYSRLVDIYRDELYEETTYSFSWEDKDGESLYSVDGSYNKMVVPCNNLYHFYSKASDIWNSQLFSKSVANLEKGNIVFFNIKFNDIKKYDTIKKNNDINKIGLNNALFEFCYENEIEKIHFNDIKEIVVKEGSIAIFYSETSLGNKDGKYLLKLSYISNADTFVGLLTMLSEDKLKGKVKIDYAEFDDLYSIFEKMQ